MYSAYDDPKGPGFPIRIFPDQRLLPPSRNFSQGATSFIASRCQGIHQMPFSACSKSVMHSDKPLLRRLALEKRMTASREDTIRAQPCAPNNWDAVVAASRSKPYSRCTKSPPDRFPEPELVFWLFSRSRYLREPLNGALTSAAWPLWRPNSLVATGDHRLLRRPYGLVELTGIEPVTSCLQSRRSPN